MKTIIIYDKSGTIITQYSSEIVREPKGLPYIILEDHQIEYQSDAYKPIIGVDVSVEPNVPIYGKSAYEQRYEMLTLEEAQTIKQNENKNALADFLENNPIQWIDGLYYGVTQEDQDEMIADKTAYDFKKSLGDDSWKLQWHSIHSACRDFTEEEFAGLLNTIVNFVYPYRQLEMQYKKSIYESTSKDEIMNMSFDYSIKTDTSEDTSEVVDNVTESGDTDDVAGES